MLARRLPLRSLAALAAAAVLLQAPTGAAAGEWRLPAERRYEQPAICTADPERAGKPTRPSHATFSVCEDQLAIFRQGLAEARQQGKLLLVVFGATWCSWCATLQKHMPGPELLGHRDGDHVKGGADLGERYHRIEIAVSTLDKGRKVDVPSGEELLALLLAKAGAAKVRVIPFIAIVDPGNDARVLARNLDDLATRNGDYNLGRLRTLLADAHGAMREGRVLAGEPGWLGRKWQRLWN